MGRVLVLSMAKVTLTLPGSPGGMVVVARPPLPPVPSPGTMAPPPPPPSAGELVVSEPQAMSVSNERQARHERMGTSVGGCRSYHRCRDHGHVDSGTLAAAWNDPS